MKILSCLTKYEELVPLLKAGADEVYFAVRWLNNYSNNGVINDFSEFKMIVKKLNKLKVKYHLAINSFDPPNISKDYKILEETIKFGIDSVIVSDIGFADYMLKNFKNLKIHLSSLLNISNTESLKFILDFLDKERIARLILPNHLSAYEASQIIKFCKENRIETEIFFFRNFGCVFINGFCYFHGNRYFPNDYTQDGRFCRFGKKNFKISVKNKVLEREFLNKIIKRFNYGLTPRVLNAAGFFEYCFQGVDFVKYGTRSDDTQTKIKNITFIKKCLLVISNLINKYDKDKARLMFLSYLEKMR